MIQKSATLDTSLMQEGFTILTPIGSPLQGKAFNQTELSQKASTYPNPAKEDISLEALREYVAGLDMDD
ncbi:MAG: hypothetical protein K6E50_00065 [Lachnospiraceae bacterium]|nr:hypothetical protein [Lachnospiraceae bacterium]